MIQRCRRSQALSPISFLLTATILICNCITANAATYQLSYDAILNTTEVHRLQQEQIKELPPAELEKMLMPPFTEGLGGIGGLDFIMDKIQQNVVEFWHSHKNEQEEGRVHDDAKVECLPKGKKARCFLDYDIGSDIVFSIDSSVHQLYGDKAQKGTQDFSEDGAWDVRFDVIVDADSDAAPGLFSRDVLIYILNHVFGSIVTANSPAPVWSIDERPSPLDQNLKLRILEEWQIIPGSRASSLEKIVLTNSNAAARLPLQTYSNAWLANGLEVPPPSIDIWTIEEVGRRPVTSLFLDGVIRATTGDAGIAYAEAFVHPALLSHPDPRRVAVISDMPLPLLKEILKYKSISEVTLVGSHMAAMSSACFHLKELNECYINGETSDCLNDGRVEIAKEGVDEWLNTKLAELHTNEGGSEYDVFLVDVSSPAQNEQFLSSTCSAKIQQLIGDESIIIYNAGVQPSHDTNHDHMSHDWARDDFLVRTSLSYFHQFRVFKLYTYTQTY
jgi:spermidine synthase